MAAEAATITGLIAFAATVLESTKYLISLCIKYKAIATDVETLADEIRHLDQILQEARTLYEDPATKECQHPKVLRQLGLQVVKCNDGLRALEKILNSFQSPHDGSSKKLIRKLKAALDGGEFVKMGTIIKGYRDQLAISILVMNTNVGVRNNEDIKDTKETLLLHQEEIRAENLKEFSKLQATLGTSSQNLEENMEQRLVAAFPAAMSREEQIEEDFEKHKLPDLRNWIGNTLDYDILQANQFQYISVQDNDSTRWVFETDSFKKLVSGQTKLLWLHGPPGCGKSVIASSIVHHLSLPPGDGTLSKVFVGYAFSDKRDDRKRSSLGLIRAVLWQIICSPLLNADNKKVVLDDLRNTPTLGGIVNSDPCHEEAGVRSSLERLQKYLKFFSQAFLVFDGLDECTDAHAIPQGFADDHFLETTNSQIILVSQRSPSISGCLDPVACQIDMRSEEVRGFTDQDIGNYARIGFLAAKVKIKDELSIEDLVHLIVTEARGMFLWAKLALPVIVEASKSAELIEEVRMELRDLGLEELDKLFLRHLKNIFQIDLSLGKKQAKTRRKNVAVLMRLAFHSTRPMTLLELQHAANFGRGRSVSWKSELLQPSIELNLQNVRDLLSSCYPLLDVRDNVAEVAHSSFKDMLLPSDDGDTALEAISSVLGDHSMQVHMVRLCLAYLEQREFEIRIRTWDNLEALLKDYPLLSYATMAWIPHLERTRNFDNKLKEYIESFLSSQQARSWLDQWIFSDLSPHADDLESSESKLNSKEGYLDDPQWLLSLMEKSVNEKKAVDIDPVLTIYLVEILSDMYLRHGKTQKAEREYSWILEYYKTNKYDAKAIINVERNLAEVWNEMGRVQEAKQKLEELLSKIKIIEAPNGPVSLAIRLDIAAVLGKLGHYKQANELSAGIYEMRKSMHGEKAAGTIQALFS